MPEHLQSHLPFRLHSLRGSCYAQVSASEGKGEGDAGQTNRHFSLSPQGKCEWEWDWMPKEFWQLTAVVGRSDNEGEMIVILLDL